MHLAVSFTSNAVGLGIEMKLPANYFYCIRGDEVTVVCVKDAAVLGSDDVGCYKLLAGVANDALQWPSSCLLHSHLDFIDCYLNFNVCIMSTFQVQV